MSKIKQPRPTVDQLVSEETRNTVEEKAKELMNSPNTSLLLTEDVRLEKINVGGKNRLQARERSGKFVARTEASAMVTAKTTQTFLAGDDPETGFSRHETLLHSLYTGAKTAADQPKNLGNAVKAVELIDEMSGHAAARAEALANHDNILNPINIVFIPVTNIMHPEVVDGDKPVEKPKQPSFAEVLDVRTDAAH